MTALNLPDRAFAAFLFDMDGTILSSIAAAERVWARWAARRGLDVAAFLPTIHGMRSVETVRRLNLPGVDPVAEAAGAAVVVISATHAHPLHTAHASVHDYRTAPCACT